LGELENVSIYLQIPLVVELWKIVVCLSSIL
jgi:hypothetical protein